MFHLSTILITFQSKSLIKDLFQINFSKRKRNALAACNFFSRRTSLKRVFETVLCKYDQFPIHRLKHQCSYYIRGIDKICCSIAIDAESVLSTLNYIFGER